ncbi:MAG: VWA domain-containing protein [Solirubrobacterales bacterium]|nr:VWA domain-containing protein [Solirubrobacterales bacterium]
MELDAKLNFDLIAVESEDTVHLLLELTAPTLEAQETRPPATLQVVLDRSGSMFGPRLDAALRAVHSLSSRLRPEDRFGLVTFDDDVDVPVPAGEIGDGTAVRRALTRIEPGNMTNLSAGVLRGIQEAQRAADGSGATLVLLSDGHANRGVTDHTPLAEFAAGALDAGITSSTIGIGDGYDEDLLAAISRGGSGNAHFAENGDEAGAQLASEVEGLLETTVQAASLTVRPGAQVSELRLYNDLPVSEITDGFMAELGDFHGGETRRLLLEVDVPAITGIGLAEVASLELRWVDVTSMESKLATIPVNVNVVPGDEAAGRTANPEVETELAFQRAQRAKRDATDALRDGDQTRAAEIWLTASEDLRGAAGKAPADKAEELAAEADLLTNLADESSMDATVARKRALADHHRKSSKRGRS